MKYFAIAFVLLLSTISAHARTPLVAVIGSQSGHLAYLQQDMFRAAQYGIDELNAKGGLLGKQIAIVNLDNRSDASFSTQMAGKAIAMDAVCVIGPMVSSHAVATARVLQEAGTPMIATTATAPQVTLVGDYIFRACFTDEFQGRALGYFMYRHLGIRHAAIMQQTNETYPASLAKAFAKGFISLGGKISIKEYYRAEQTDFATELDVIRHTDAEAIMIPGYAKEAAAIIAQARSMGITMPLVGGDAWGRRVHTMTSRQSLDNCYQLRHWHRSTSNDKSRMFLAGYEAIYGFMLQDVGALAYDCVQLFAAAVRKAGSFDREAIRDALQSVEIEGITGKIRFNANGDPVKPALILTYTDGKPTFYMILEP